MAQTIQTIYDLYRIMPALQLHQYRVAAVASLLCDATQDFEEKEFVISACLLHDMGNILKFDLEKFPEFLQPEGVEYWQKVQHETKAIYGTNEHQASLEMARELKVPQRVLELIDAVGFMSAPENLESRDLAKQICAYADMRVGPHGVLSLEERLVDLKKRYATRWLLEAADKDWDVFAEALLEIEKLVFKEMNGLQPDEITDEAIAALVAELPSFRLSIK